MVNPLQTLRQRQVSYLEAKRTPSTQAEKKKAATQAVIETMKSPIVEPRKQETAPPGAFDNVISALTYGTLGLGGGTAVTAIKQLTEPNKPLNIVEATATQATGGLLGIPATIATAATVQESISQKGLTMAPEIGAPSIAPEGVTPRIGEVSYAQVVPDPEGIIPKLPDVGTIGKYALIVGGALAGVYLLGKFLGRK